MCIVFYTTSQPGYKLILGANRDEFLDRPTLPASWHAFNDASTDATPSVRTPRGGSPVDGAHVLCGRDLGSVLHGTWIGMTRDLRVGTLTNIRYPLRPTPPNAPSRGALVKDFLARPPQAALSVKEYLGSLEPERYEGFNLLLFHLHKHGPSVSVPAGAAEATKHEPSTEPSTQTTLASQPTWSATEIGYLSNRPTPTLLYGTPDLPIQKSGCVGMSNSPLSEPYPKVVGGEAHMAELLAKWAEKGGGEEALVERMMEVLSPAPPVTSPADLDRATMVTPLRIQHGSAADDAFFGGRWYGTRVATVVLVRDNGEVVFVERDRHVLEDGEVKPGHEERRFVFEAQGDEL